MTLIYKFDDLGLESLSPPSMSISENTLAISLKVSEMSGQTRFKNRLCVWRWKEGISKEGSIERIKKDEVSCSLPRHSSQAVTYSNFRWQLEGVYYAPTLINDVWLIAGKDHKCGDKFNYALHIVNVHNLSEGKTVKLGLPVPTKKYPTFQLRSGASALYEEPRPDSPGTIIMAFMGDSDGDRCFVTAMLIDELLKPPMPEETRRKNTPHEWQSLKEMELKSFTELIEPMPCIPKNSLGLLVSGPNILWPMTKTDEDEFKVSVWKCNLSKGPDSRLKIDGKQYTIHNVDLNKSRVMIVKERVVHIKVIR